MTQIDARPRVVVDTNLFVNGTILKRGNPYKLLSAWRASAFVLLMSADKLHELMDVFGRPKIVDRSQLTTSELADRFERLAAVPRAAPIETPSVTVRDPEDKHLLATALGADATHLVSGGDDLLVLRDDPRLGAPQIVTAVEFPALLARRMRETM
jgi:putative PIN family toxin of toxin-antitoxin system